MIVDAVVDVSNNQKASKSQRNGIFKAFSNQGGAGGSFSLGASGQIVFHNTANIFSFNNQRYNLFASIAELQSLVAKQPSGHFALARSISAKSAAPYTAVVPAAFTGTIEGLGNSISLLSLAGNGGSTGLFAQLGQASPPLGATISNLRLQVNLATTDGSGGGALAGTAYNTTLNHVTIAGKLMATEPTAAAAGTPLGGLVGTMSGGSMANCVNHASVTIAGAAPGVAGGLVGAANGVAIAGSLSTGAVSGVLASRAGGLAGSASAAAITNSFTTGSVGVGAGGSAGGLIGTDAASTLQSSYANTPVTADSGGVAGTLIGHETQGNPAATDVYWDNIVTGTLRAVGEGGAIGADGMSKAELAAALPAGFDPSIWTQTAGVYQGLPYLIALPAP